MMTSSNFKNVPPPKEGAKGSVYSRFIPREELSSFSSWSPDSLSGSTTRSGTGAPAEDPLPPAEVLAQHPLHLASRVEEPRHDGALGHLHRFGDLLVRQPFDLTQDDRRAVVRGQLVEAALHDLDEARAVERREGVELAARGQPLVRRAGEVGVVLELHRAARRAAADEVDGEVVDDAVEPGAEARAALEILEVPVHPEEGVLGDLPRVFGVAHDAVGDRVGPPLVAPDELLERAHVPLRRAGDEVTVMLSGVGAGCILGLRRAIRPWIQNALASGAHQSRSFRCRSGAHVEAGAEHH